jgi:opacity protein-like surface antigen
MSRRLVIALALVAPAARAQPAPVDAPSTADEVGDQGIGADIGAATGGRDTPGGARVSGHYLYQLSDSDWFDGTASFTYGGGGAACFRDRMNTYVCEHGIAEGRGVEITAAVRRFFAAQGQFRPFARAGIGVGLVHFPDDSVSGLAIPLHLGGGVRATVAESIAIVAQADLAVGFGWLDKSLGLEPQLGLSVVAGAEFRLQ